MKHKTHYIIPQLLWEKISRIQIRFSVRFPVFVLLMVKLKKKINAGEFVLLTYSFIYSLGSDFCSSDIQISNREKFNAGEFALI